MRKCFHRAQIENTPKCNMDSMREYVQLYCPLTWYQKKMYVNTTASFYEAESEISKALKNINFLYREEATCAENLINAGSIGYNEVVDFMPLSRVSLALKNHGLNEKYTWLYYTEDTNEIIMKSYNYYNNLIECVAKARQAKAYLKESNKNRWRYAYFTVCECIMESPVSFKKNVICRKCAENWLPQHVAAMTCSCCDSEIRKGAQIEFWYPELFDCDKKPNSPSPYNDTVQTMQFCYPQECIHSKPKVAWIETKVIPRAKTPICETHKS